MTRVLAFLCAGVLASAGCATDPAKRQRAVAGDGPRVANVVARVNGRAIGSAEVEARMRSDGVDAQTALQRLIDEEILIQEAVRLGFSETREDERTVERLMVRIMLKDFETELSPESISDEEVREDFAEHADKFQIPERRESWHVLVKEPGEAGRALAEQIVEELQAAQDTQTVYERYADGTPPGSALEVKREELPAISMKANIEDPYKNALFAAKSTGPLRSPVQTSYGWHAIVLTEIIPEERRTIDDVEDEIRERLSQKKRFVNLVERVERLEARGLVEYDEQGVERLMSMPGLPERGGD